MQKRGRMTRQIVELYRWYFIQYLGKVGGVLEGKRMWGGLKELIVLGYQNGD